MRISIYWPGFIFLLFTGSNELTWGQEEKTLSLNIMTYNIRYAADQPEVYRLNNRRHGIMHSFEGIDIAGLQEVLNVQVEDLKSSLSGYNLIYRSREAEASVGEGVPILFKEDKFSLLYSGTFWLSDTPELPGSNTWEAACNRIVTWGRFIDKESNLEFFVFNTHLDHISQYARENGTRLILSTIQMMAPGFPVILMGDFNADEENNVYKMITEFGLKDTYRDIRHDSDSTDLTYHGWQNESGLTRIDYVFVSTDFHVKNTKVVREKVNGIYPSDHFPVVSDIEITRPE